MNRRKTADARMRDLVNLRKTGEAHKRGYTVRKSYIGPLERYDYIVYMNGGEVPLAFKKSLSAALNFALKQPDVGERGALTGEPLPYSRVDR